MFLSDKVSMPYNMSIDGYVLGEKLSFEDKALKPVVPILKDVDVHPYRWVRLTVPEGFVCKINQLSMPPGFSWFVDYFSIQKSLVMYDYLTWKIRSYKSNKKVLDDDPTVSKAKEVADTLFVDMLSKEGNVDGWKLAVVKFLVKNFNNSVLSIRDDEAKRMVDAN